MFDPKRLRLDRLRTRRPRLSALRSRKALIRLAGVSAVVLVAIGIGAYIYERNRTGSIYPHRNGRFIIQIAPKPPTKGSDAFSWPIYGYTKDHLRFFPAPATLQPPFRQRWARGQSALLEFPPVIYGDRIFQLADDGVLAAIDKRNGHFDWVRKLGASSASTPAVTANAVYATLFSRESGLEAGRAVALNPTNGKVRWSRQLPSPSESSPLVDRGKVFFGTQDGTVYALNTRTGATVWTYHAEGAVKASPTLKNGVLYFGDYSGNLQAVGERAGRRLWRSGSEGAVVGSGTFYSTAAVAFGRVFLGNTDGRIYAYDQRSGSLDWAVQTGAYVYASPAVADAPGRGPTIYLGSYDGNFYALNAHTGNIEWTYNAHGRISGSATIVGSIVYFSDLGTHTAIGLNISSGRPVYRFHEGSFDPVITDGHDIYLTGYNTLNALEPIPPGSKPLGGRRAGRRRRA